MSYQNNPNAPITVPFLHAQLRTATTIKDRLRFYIAFLKAPSACTAAEQLKEASEALQCPWKDRYLSSPPDSYLMPIPDNYRLLAAELHLLRARLHMDEHIARPEAALKDLHRTVSLCGDGTGEKPAGLLLDAGRMFNELKEYSAAIGANKDAVRACGDLDDAPAQKGESDTSISRTLQSIRTEAITCILERAHRYAEEKEYDKAISTYRNAAQTCGWLEAPAPGRQKGKTKKELPHNDLQQLCSQAYQGEGNCLLHLEKFPEALHRLLQALALSTHAHDDTTMVVVLKATVARIYAQLGDPKSDTFYEQAVDATRSCEHKKELAPAVAEAYEHLAAASLAMHKTDEARNHALRARTLYMELKDSLGQTRMLVINGEIYIAESQLEAAAREFAAAYSELELQGEQRLLGQLLLKIGKLHRHMEQLHRSVLWLLRALSVAEEIGDLRIQRDIHYEISSTYEDLGQSWKALQYFKSGALLERRIREKEQNNALAELQAAFDPAQARRNEKLLRVTQQELVGKKKRLALLGAQLVHKWERLNALRNQLRSLEGLVPKQNGERILKGLKSMQSEITMTLNADSDWETYFKEIAQIHPGVVRRLQKWNPALTAMEIKVSSLIMLDGMPHKRIGEVLCSAERTVNKHVQNIRSKFSLPSDEHLGSFIQSLTDETI